MRITVVHKPSGEETSYTMRGGSARLRVVDAVPTSGGDLQQRLQWQFIDWRHLWQRAGRWLGHYIGPWLRWFGRGVSTPLTYPVVIRFDGRNVKVTDQGGPYRLYLLEQPLPLQQAWSWLSEQELQYGDFILWWEITPTDRRPLRQRVPLERTTRLLLPFLLVAAFFALGLLAWTTNQAREAVIKAPAVAVLPPLTATWTPCPTRTMTPPASPTPTAISTRTRSAPRVQSLDERDVAATFTPTVTPTLPPAKATKVAARFICRETTPLALDKALKDLHVEVKPACVISGEYYWRLTGAAWLDETASQGLHHVFVYLQSDQPLDEKITMRWETDACTREVKDASGTNCPMYNAGFAYQVRVEGLPSEQVINIGLGTVDKRDWTIRTTFHLTFTKTLYTYQAP